LFLWPGTNESLQKVLGDLFALGKMTHLTTFRQKTVGNVKLSQVSNQNVLKISKELFSQQILINVARQQLTEIDDVAFSSKM
jgi:hypothetical protein